MTAPIRKVLLVGANGSLGSDVLDALVAAGSFDVSILQRSNSSSKPAHADRITTIPVSPVMTLDELQTAVTGQDAVIAAFPLKDVTQHLRLAEAAFHAGVRRYIPADYGSCDASRPQPQKYLQLYRDKDAVQKKCAELAASASAASKPFTWTSIVCGHFFDWAVRHEHLGLDIDGRKALLLDGGVTKASMSTMPQVAKAVVAVLQRPEVTENRFVHIQGFCVTPLEVVAAFERATGAVWHKETVDSNALLEREFEKYKAGDDHAVHEIVYVLGAVDADWTTLPTFAMDLLGLEEENLDKVVADLVAEHSAKKA
ncbi:hypothetical protein VHEMI03026 [[Torrubiella] hemipterigena]|uniref:NmrA-like domain-containing protein n=1 Tax=[Torrubiella] hemipterigena TaxID=1531966 RepID=A0A0A1T9W3_9HYPO|nr:hypothetical protein VHEMI03026 [[Torrubiella] hemipterigena]